MGSGTPLRRFDGLEVFPLCVAARIQYSHCLISRLLCFSRVPSSTLPCGLPQTATLLRFFTPAAHAATKTRFTRACLTRHLPTPGNLTLLPVYVLRNLPALFHAGYAHGVDLQGFFPRPEPQSLFRVGPLPAVVRGLSDCSENLWSQPQGFTLWRDSTLSSQGESGSEPVPSWFFGF